MRIRLTIEIDTDNAAFEDYPLEVGRLVRVVANAMDIGRQSGTLRDANGNSVGTFKKEVV